MVAPRLLAVHNLLGPRRPGPRGQGQQDRGCHAEDRELRRHLPYWRLSQSAIPDVLGSGGGERACAQCGQLRRGHHVARGGGGACGAPPGAGGMEVPFSSSPRRHPRPRQDQRRCHPRRPRAAGVGRCLRRDRVAAVQRGRLHAGRRRRRHGGAQRHPHRPAGRIGRGIRGDAASRSCWATALPSSRTRSAAGHPPVSSSTGGAPRRRRLASSGRSASVSTPTCPRRRGGGRGAQVGVAGRRGPRPRDRHRAGIACCRLGAARGLGAPGCAGRRPDLDRGQHRLRPRLPPARRRARQRRTRSDDRRHPAGRRLRRVAAARTGALASATRTPTVRDQIASSRDDLRYAESFLTWRGFLPASHPAVPNPIALRPPSLRSNAWKFGCSAAATRAASSTSTQPGEHGERRHRPDDDGPHGRRAPTPASPPTRWTGSRTRSARRSWLWSSTSTARDASSASSPMSIPPPWPSVTSSR